MDEVRPGTYTQKQKKCYHGASRKHEHHRSKLTTVARHDVLVVVAVVAAAEGEDSKVDPAAGKELIDKKSQMTQVKLGQAQLGLGTHIHHPSHDDQLRPEDDPGRDVRKTLLEVQVQVGEAEKSRSNEDV